MDQEDFDNAHGYYFEQLSVGMEAEYSKVIADADVDAYADLSGDANPLHLDEAFATRTRAKGRVAHGMLTASLLSTIVGCRLPGPGCLWISQTLRFLRPVRTGDEVRARGTVVELNSERQQVKMEMVCSVRGEPVLEGDALLWVPRRAAD